MVVVRARRRWGRALLVGVVALLASAPAAVARVALVATGTPQLVLLDITTRDVAARLPLPGPARAVAVSRDGRRGFVTAGGEVVAVDVNSRAETGRTQLGGAEIADIELAPSGTVLYAVEGARLLALDARTLAPVGAAVELRGEGGQIAVDAGGELAAVTLRSGRVAMVDLGRKVLLRHVRLPGAMGVAIADNRVTYVTARGRLRAIAPGQHRARKRAIRLPPGAGGWLTLSPGHSRIVVGAAAGGAAAALFDLASGTVRRLGSGTGPGRGAWYPDASRILMADGGAATISLVSPFSRGRVGRVALPGTAPADLVVQPGLALISGTDGPDRITGTRGADEIQGLGGDDLLRGGRDRDVLLGGLGADDLSGGSFNDQLDGGDGNDFLLGGTGNDVLLGGPGDDGADGGTGNDELQGGDGDDQLDGGDGDDSILGGTGNDTIVEKGFGDDKLLDGGPGDDLIRGGRGSDQMIQGGDGNDQLYGETGAERIQGGDGNDLIDGGPAGDRLEGQQGDDTIKGDSGNDHLYGHEGNDQLDGGSGNDELFGHEGNDLLVGGSGTDTLDGGPGDDAIRAADASIDTVNCGPGSDTVYVEAPLEDVLTDCESVITIAPEPDTDATVTQAIRGTRRNDVLRGTPGNDSFFGRGGPDEIFGLGGDDYVDGDAGNDRLHGGPGRDLMAGRRGDDVIWGDAGDDRITGDRGRDRIFGGPGNYQLYGNLGPDVIDGGPGNDRINVVHGDRDRVVCGPGGDVVFADPRDVVAGDCESVRR
jgi:Ca2+-binding RTX toxin-like protein